MRLYISEFLKNLATFEESRLEECCAFFARTGHSFANLQRHNTGAKKTNIQVLTSVITCEPLNVGSSLQQTFTRLFWPGPEPGNVGGAEEDRTPDLLRARQALSQLSYGPGVLAPQVPEVAPQLRTCR